MHKPLALKNHYLQQVEWAVFSPSLMAKPSPVNYIRDEQHKRSVIALLLRLDEHQTQVDQHFLSLSHMPMGKYFEQLLFFILQRDERYEIILQNHQIVEGKTTVGEIDLVVRDTVSDQLEHWEIALKFYLQSTTGSEQFTMLGPDAKDNLARKIKKLTEHQMTLSSHPQIQHLLKLQSIDCKLFIKGQFFYHLNNRKLMTNDAYPLHDRGWWCLHSEVEQMLNDNLKWAILDKPDWIGSHQTTAGHTLNTPYQLSAFLADHFSHQHQAVFCVGMKESNGIWQEKSRGFVVNNTWPHPMPLKA